MRNSQLLDDINKILSEEQEEAVYALTGSRPVSFAALRKNREHKKIRDLLNENIQKSKIARQVGCSVKTIERHQKRLLHRFRNNNDSK